MGVIVKLYVDNLKFGILKINLYIGHTSVLLRELKSLK